MIYLFFKRFFDFTFAAVTLIVLSPLLLFISVILLLSGTYPVFLSYRGGLHNKPFLMYKFKTMRGNPADGPDEMRITPVGRWLRHTSLDELPQLINVLRGEMSVVGPRPLPIEYYHRCNENQKRRYRAKPGLAGPVQALGRNALSWEKRFEYDVHYANNQDLLTDIKWFFKTFVKLMLPKAKETQPGEVFKHK